MAILDAMQKAAIRLIGRKPAPFFGSSETFELEITDLANDVATDMAQYNEWQALTQMATIAADGVTTAFNLPPDYDRMLLAADIQDTAGWFWGYRHIFDVNEFTYWQNRGFVGVPGAWIIYQNQLHFSPAPTQDATYPYVSKNYASAGGTPKAAFNADTDDFRLDSVVLTLGIVWRWRANKMLDFTGDQENYQTALEQAAARDRGSRVIRRTRRNTFPGTYPAWPGVLGP